MNPLNFFRQNIFLKIISLLFAIVLWFFVVLEDKVEQDIQIAVHYQNIPKGLMLVKAPRKVLVKVVGPRSILRNLSRRPLSLSLDLKKLRAGKHLITIGAKDLSLPAGLEVVDIEPEKIEVVLERIVTRKLPVEAVIEGSPPPGWKIAEVKVTPAKIRLCGPESLLFGLRRVKTKPININGLTGEVVKIVEVDLPKEIKFGLPRMVKVQIKIVEKVVEREIKDLPIKVVGSEKEVKLEPEKVSAILKGPERVLGPFSETKIKAIVDLTHLKQGWHRVRVKLIIPPEVKILELKPKQIKVFIPK